MKDGIHPKLYKDAKVTCACGNSFVTISTRETISVEICSACHPFYTGQQKFVDTEGRIDKFKKKQIVSETKKQEAQKVKKSKKSKSQTDSNGPQQPVSLKEMLEQARDNS